MIISFSAAVNVLCDIRRFVFTFFRFQSLLTVAWVVVALFPGVLMAQALPGSDPAPIATAICNVLNVLNGPLIGSLAAAAIVVFVLGAMFGRWDTSLALKMVAVVVVLASLPTLITILMENRCFNFPTYKSVTVTDSPIATVICSVVNWFAGPVGVAISNAVIAAFFIQALFGRVDIQRFFIIIVAIVIVFSAGTVAKIIAPSITPCA